MTSPIRFTAAAMLSATIALPITAGSLSAKSAPLQFLDEARTAVLRDLGPWPEIRDELLEGIATAQARAGGSAEARRTVRDLPRDAPRDVRRVVLTLARTGDLNAALELAETLGEGLVEVVTNPANGSTMMRTGSLRNDTLERVIEILIERREWDKVPLVVQRIPETEHTFLPHSTFREHARMTAAKAYLRAGALDEATSTLESMGRAWLANEPTLGLVNALIDQGDFQQAQEWARKAPYRHSRIDSLLSIVTAAQARDKPDAAAAALAEARNLAATWEREDCRASYGIAALARIAVLQAKACDAPAARETMRIAASQAMNQICGYINLGTVAAGYADIGEFDEAWKIADSISDRYARIEALGDIATALENARKHAEAQATIKSARALHDEMKEAPRSDLLEIGKAQIRIRDLQGALQTADAIGRSAYAHDLRMRVARAHAENGDFDRALEIARAAHSSTAREIRTIVAIAQAQRGMAIDPPLEGYGRDGEKIVRVQVARGEFDCAIDTASRIRTIGTTERSLRLIAAEQAKHGDFRSVLAWASKEWVERSRSAVLLGVAEGLLARPDR